jgi:hypothetical protein
VAARSVLVSFTNATGFVLGKWWEGLDHGVWTDDIEPPQTITPGETVTWMSESDGFATGTEGRVQYTVGDGGSVIELHWNNPFVGANTFDEHCIGGWSLLRSGGDGEDAKVSWTFEPAQWHVTNFRPSSNGFHFANSWPPGTFHTVIDLGVACPRRRRPRRRAPGTRCSTTSSRGCGTPSTSRTSRSSCSSS